MDNLLIKVGLNSSAVKTGLSEVKKQFVDLRGAMTGMFTGAFTGLSLVKLFDGAREKAKDIHELSRKFGDSPEEVQKLGAAVKKVGGDMETAAKGGFKAFLEAQKAVSGDEGARKHFEALNIPLEKLAELHGPRDTLLTIADAVQHATDQHQALAAAGELVGARQASLIQLFRMGGDAMRKAGDDAVVMSNRTVESLVRVEKGLGRVKNTATNIFGNLLVGAHDMIGISFESMGSAIGTVWNSIFYGPKAALETLDQKLAEIKAKYSNQPEKDDALKGSIAESEEQNDAEKRAAEELDRLKDQLARSELERQRDLMSLEEKRTSLVRERVSLLTAAGNAGFDSAEGLKKRIEAERALRDIQRVDKDMAEAKKKADEEAGKAAAEVAKKQLDYMEKFNRVHGHAEEAFLEGLDDSGKKSYLGKKLSMLEGTLARENDPEKRLDLEDERIKLSRQLAAIGRKDTDRLQRSVAAGDLTRHGGGGIAFFDRTEDAQLRAAKAAEKTADGVGKSQQTLDRIEQNTRDQRWGR